MNTFNSFWEIWGNQSGTISEISVFNAITADPNVYSVPIMWRGMLVGEVYVDCLYDDEDPANQSNDSFEIYVNVCSDFKNEKDLEEALSCNNCPEPVVTVSDARTALKYAKKLAKIYADEVAEIRG